MSLSSFSLRSLVRTFTLMATLLVASGVQAAPHYFINIFSFQSGPLNLPNQSHTFATFFATDDTGTPIANTRFDISWLPYDGDFRTLGPATLGRNFSVEESLGLTLQDNRGRINPNDISNGNRIRRYGPYGIAVEFYNKSLAMNQRLAYWGGAIAAKAYNQSGGNLTFGNGMIAYPGIFYKAVDKNPRTTQFLDQFTWNPSPATAINCIHAVTDIGGFIETNNARGFEGGRIATSWLNARHPGQHFLSAPNQTFNQVVAQKFRFVIANTVLSLAAITPEYGL